MSEESKRLACHVMIVVYNNWIASRRLTADQRQKLISAIECIDGIQQLIDDGLDGAMFIDSERTYKTVVGYCIDRLAINSAKVFLRKGCDLSRLPCGDFPLRDAVEYKDLELVQMLLDNKCDTSTVDHTFGKSAIHIACELNLTDIAKELIRRSNVSTLNICDGGGRTALMYASRYASREVVESLLEKGCSINATDKYGKNALYHSMRRIQTAPSAGIMYSLIRAGISLGWMNSADRASLIKFLQSHTLI